MANVKISDLTAASAAAGANEYEINEAGTSKKVTGTQISAFVKADLLDDTTVNFTGTLQNGGSNVIVDTDINSTVIGYVAPGTSGNLLTSNGSAWTSAAPAASGGFDSGTLMLFQQTAAPTGWTKQTTHNNKALRVVSATASSGGSVAFTTAFASQTPTGSVTITSVTGSAGSTTLSTPQIPSHTHNYDRTSEQPLLQVLQVVRGQQLFQHHKFLLTHIIMTELVNSHFLVVLLGLLLSGVI